LLALIGLALLLVYGLIGCHPQGGRVAPSRDGSGQIRRDQSVRLQIVLLLTPPLRRLSGISISLVLHMDPDSDFTIFGARA